MEEAPVARILYDKSPPGVLALSRRPPHNPPEQELASAWRRNSRDAFLDIPVNQHTGMRSPPRSQCWGPDIVLTQPPTAGCANVVGVKAWNSQWGPSHEFRETSCLALLCDDRSKIGQVFFFPAGRSPS